jgi:hypothetical protein
MFRISLFRETDAKQAKNLVKQPLVLLILLFRETAINRYVKNPEES